MTELLKDLGIQEIEEFRKIARRDWSHNPPREMWKHTGKCSCGRRTFLFGQRMRCIAEEAGLEARPEDEEAVPGEVLETQPDGPEVDILAVSASIQERSKLHSRISADQVLRAAAGQEHSSPELEWLQA